MDKKLGLRFRYQSQLLPNHQKNVYVTEGKSNLFSLKTNCISQKNLGGTTRKLMSKV